MINFYNDSFKRHRIESRYARPLLPKRCIITGRWLWLNKSYKETAMWTGPGDAVFETVWFDKNAYLIAKLAGSL